MEHTDHQEQITAVQAAYGYGRENALQQVRTDVRIEGSGKPFVLIPSDMSLQDVEKHLDAPLRISESHAFLDPQSLAGYLARFGGPNTQIFASLKSHQIKAVLDYHGPESPSWGTHLARLECELSDDWKAWTGFDGKTLGQIQFAEFLEDHQFNVIDPESAVVEEAVKNLEANKTVVFKSGVNLHNGATEFKYVESIEDNRQQTLKVPNKLVLGIQPFNFGKPYEVLARLRYRLNDGKLSFTYVLDRPDRVLKDAFQKVVKEVGELTGIEPYLTA